MHIWLSWLERSGGVKELINGRRDWGSEVKLGEVMNDVLVGLETWMISIALGSEQSPSTLLSRLRPPLVHSKTRRKLKMLRSTPGSNVGEPPEVQIIAFNLVSGNGSLQRIERRLVGLAF